MHSADGTRLRAWTNDADGPTVLLCNGLGTNPHAWPSLTRPDCGVRIISWNHRGTGGSDRPKDRRRVDLDAFVEDALAIMDDAGVDRCIVMGWSAGVTVAFELAGRHPDRVAGIFAVNGVPGNTLGHLAADSPPPARSPRHSWCRELTLRGPPVATLVGDHDGHSRHVHDRQPAALDAPRRCEFRPACGPRDGPGDAVHRPGPGTPISRSGIATHRRVSLSSVKVPVTMLAGTRDHLTSAHEMRSAAERLHDVVFIEIDATHFIPFGQPELVLAELKNVLKRVGEG